MTSAPLVVAFADYTYRRLLDIWHRQLTNLGIERIRVFALDAATVRFCARRGIDAIPIEWNGELGDLWGRRIVVFKQLLSTEPQFIHSDIDAIWLKNPLTHGSAAQLNDDLIFTQGTDWPNDVHAKWGFVLCCGWFWARSSPASHAFFDALQSDVRVTGDDQMSANRLLAASGAQWKSDPAQAYEMRSSGREMTCWTAPIRATTPDGLSVALLPHREFQRLPEATDRAVVKHFQSPKNGADKLRMLARHGLIGGPFASMSRWRDMLTGAGAQNA